MGFCAFGNDNSGLIKYIEFMNYIIEYYVFRGFSSWNWTGWGCNGTCRAVVSVVPQIT